MRFLIIRFDKEHRKNKFIPIISQINNFKNSKLFWAITVRNEIFKPETSIAVGDVRWNDRSQLNNHKNNCCHVLLCGIMYFFIVRLSLLIQQPPRICWTSKGSLFTLDVSLFRMYRTVYRAIRELIQWRQGESNLFHEKITLKATTPHVHRTLGVFLWLLWRHFIEWVIISRFMKNVKIVFLFFLSWLRSVRIQLHAE